MQVGYKLVEIATGSVVETWGGIWGQTVSPPNPLSLPDGSQVCGAQNNDEFNGYRLDPWMMDAPPPSVNDVVVERAARLAIGFYYDFNDARGVHHIGTTDADMIGWSDVTSWANSQLALGKTDTVNIVTDTGPVAITALDWMKILDAAGAFRQPVWTASFLLENENPIPQDYRDNKYWPPAPVNPDPPPAPNLP